MLKFMVYLIFFIGLAKASSNSTDLCTEEDEHQLRQGCDGIVLGTTSNFDRRGFKNGLELTNLDTTTEGITQNTTTTESIPTTLEKEKLLLRKTIIVTGKPFQVQIYSFYFDTYVRKREVITCIKIEDRVLNNRGGCPIVKNGGVSFREVELEFISQRGGDMVFYIEIFGI